MEPRDRRVASLLHPSIPCLGHVFGFVVALNVMSCVRRMASLLPPRGPVVMCSCVVDVIFMTAVRAPSWMNGGLTVRALVS